MEDLRYQVNLLTAMNEKLMNSEHIFRIASEFSGNVFVYFDMKSNLRVSLIGPWNELTGEKILGHPYDEKHLLSFVCDEDIKLITDRIINMENKGLEDVSVEFRSRSKEKWFKATAKCYYDNAKKPLEKMVCIEEITKLKKESEEIEYYAYYDTLTGLYNRNYFVSILRNMCEDAVREGTTVELLFVDIDNFKRINDQLGLVFGDELVQDLGLYLREFVSEDVKVCRYGSDVFCFAIYNPYGVKTADLIFKSIREHLRTPIKLTNGASVLITVSGGAGEYPGCGNNAIDLISNTELVLYVAKANNKGNISYFDDSVETKHIEDKRVEELISVSLEQKGFDVYYQPVFDLSDGSMYGVECFLRLPDRFGGFSCDTSRIIDITSKNGRILEITDFVLNEVFKTIHDFSVKYRAEMFYSINIAAEYLLRDNFLDEVNKLLDYYEVNPMSLQFEIKEAVFVKNIRAVSKVISALRQTGIRVCVDNFLKDSSIIKFFDEIKVDGVKLDKSCVENALKKDESQYIIEAMTKLLNVLNIDTTVVGVETNEEFEFVKSSKIDYVQGYLISKPMPKTELEKFVIRHMT